MKIFKADTEREYFEIMEGIYLGKEVSIQRRSDRSSYLSKGFLERQPVEIIYSVSERKLIFEGNEYEVDDDPTNLLEEREYDIEIPDAPHKGGLSYLDRSKMARVWFHLGHNSKEDKYLHTGRASAGCISMVEIEKWDPICVKLLLGRKGDDKSVGILKVIT